MDFKTYILRGTLVLLVVAFGIKGYLLWTTAAEAERNAYVASVADTAGKTGVQPENSESDNSHGTSEDNVTEIAASELAGQGEEGVRNTQEPQDSEETMDEGNAVESDKSQEVNIYSSRKEELVQDLFDRFTEETGIKVNFVTDKAPKLIARMQSEGENSPADLFLTADVANLGYAGELGLLSKVDSAVLKETIPAKYRDGDNNWFGLSLRVRALFYSKERVKPEELSSYEKLVAEKWKGRILVRSSSNVYNQSLIASIIEGALQEEASMKSALAVAGGWAHGLVSNFARKPQGGDTDQIRAVARGVGDIAIANSYYYGRLQASDKSEDKKVVEQVGIFFPNQDGRGTHVNISGGGVTANAKNRENAVKLLEFLVSDKAQQIYAERNHEFPVSSKVKRSDIVKSWGEFKMDKLPLSALSKHREDVLKIADKAGWR